MTSLHNRPKLRGVMCGSSETLPSVAMFCGGINVTDREIYSGKKYEVLFWSAKRKNPAYRRAAGGNHFPPSTATYSAPGHKKSFFFHTGYEVFCS